MKKKLLNYTIYKYFFIKKTFIQEVTTRMKMMKQGMTRK